MLLLENAEFSISICVDSLVLIAVVFGSTLSTSSRCDSSDSKSEEEGGCSLVVSLPTDPLSSGSAILVLLSWIA